MPCDSTNARASSAAWAGLEVAASTRQTGLPSSWQISSRQQRAFLQHPAVQDERAVGFLDVAAVRPG